MKPFSESVHTAGALRRLRFLTGRMIAFGGERDGDLFYRLFYGNPLNPPCNWQTVRVLGVSLCEPIRGALAE